MLVSLDRAARELAKCVDLDEVKTIRDKALALEAYARTAKQSATMERQCQVIRLRAERRMGQLLGGTVKRGNPQLSHGATIGLGKLGITRSQSSRWQLAASVPADEFERYLATGRDLSTAGVLRLVKRQPPLGAQSGGNILTGPASQLWDKLTDSSVDLFLTDPPYSEVERYAELAELAAVKLKTGGLCLANSGIGYLPAVLAAMAKHLKYHWIFAIKFAGGHRAVYPVKIHNGWQPVVAFRKGKCAAGWCGDHLHSGGKEKDSHNYQKTLTDCEYFIEHLTEPGQLVVDPYCGSGTVPTACKKLGRRWLACELNSDMARIARGRLAA
jgi:DNA modification methylase